MTLDKAIERYTSNAEYERTHGNLQGCLDFRQLAEWLKDYKRLKELEPCEDAIRREDAINAVSEALEHVVVENEDVARKMINKLPSVKPQELCKDAISRILKRMWNCRGKNTASIDKVKMEQIIRDELSSVNPQPKTGHWVYKIYGGFHEQGDWYCSHCDYQFNYGNGHAKYCPECGYEMSEPPTEEVIGDRDYDWVIRR